MEPVTFMASVYGQRTDKEGSARLTFDVPLSDLGAVLVLATRVNKRLRVTVEEVPETGQ